MKKIPGVRIVLTHNGDPLAIDPKTGGLGELTAGTILMTLRTSGTSVFPFSVDGKKNINRSRDYTPTYDEGTYKLRINVSVNGDEIPSTWYPGNNIRVLVVKDKGKFCLYEIAIISQRGHFFLTIQGKNARCFRQKNKTDLVICPAYDRWYQLQEMLNQIFKDKVADLPTSSFYRAGKNSAIDNLPPQTAQVIWWNHALGCGMLLTPEGPAVVHWQKIHSADFPHAPISLTPGNLVKYGRLRKPISENTCFRLEALDVKLL